MPYELQIIHKLSDSQVTWKGKRHQFNGDSVVCPVHTNVTHYVYIQVSLLSCVQVRQLYRIPGHCITLAMLWDNVARHVQVLATVSLHVQIVVLS